MAYSETLAKAIKNSAKWKLLAGLLAVAFVVMLVVSWHLSTVKQTVIVPYGFYSANKSVSVTGQPEHDALYLQILSAADLQSLLNWQPETVDKELDLFLARLAPSAYAKYNLTLRSDAKRYASDNITEVFYPKKVEFIKPATVVTTGSLLRWSGQSQTLKTRVTYRITYSHNAAGVYAISNLEVSK